MCGLVLYFALPYQTKKSNDNNHRNTYFEKLSLVNQVIENQDNVCIMTVLLAVMRAPRYCDTNNSLL